MGSAQAEEVGDMPAAGTRRTHSIRRLVTAGTMLVGCTAALALVVSSPPARSALATASPNAGECSETTAGLVCNVEGQTLSFTTVGGLTQSAGTTNRNHDPAQGASITYSSVFTDGTYTIDAVLRVDAKVSGPNGMPVIDDDDIGDDRGVAFRARNGTSAEFTISFQESISKTAVTMQNLTILVQDLDGTQNNGTVQTPNYSNAREYVIFQGLEGYITTGTPDVRVATNSAQPAYDGFGTVPGSDIAEPETGVRQFYSEETADASVDENNSVAVVFGSTTSVGIIAGTWGTGGGINFLFTTPTAGLTATRSVSSGTYTLSYDVQGGSGVQPASVTTSSAVSLSPGTGLSKASVTISGWSTLPAGAGSKYALGATFTPVKNTTLYAVYELTTVTFSANTGFGADYTQNGSGPTPLSSNSFTKAGYQFTNWATNSDGTGAVYDDAADFPFFVDDILYAQWAPIVTFDANGGSGSSATQSAIGPTALAGNTFSRSGFTFAGWSTTSTGAVTHADGATFNFTVPTTLYAQWTAVTSNNPPLPLVTLPVATTTPGTTVAPATTPAPTTTNPAPSTTVPAPVPDSGGVLPDLRPGESAATDNGVAVPVEVFLDDTSTLVMRGQDFQLNLAGDCAGGCTVVSDTAGRETIQLRRNGNALVDGFGFMPGTPVHVWMFSEPTYLGSLLVADDGTFAGSVYLSGIEPGEHTLQVNGISFDGEERSANLGVVVAADTDLTLSLPATGTDGSNGLVLVAVGLLLAGLFATTRRRV